MKNKNIVGIVLLVLILVIALVIGQYKDSNNIKNTKKTAEEYNQILDEEKKVKEENDKRIKDSLPRVLCWGDSLTAGVGGNGVNYPDVLSNLSGLSVMNYGVGGETTNLISMRQGSTPFYTNSFVIPSKKESVKISIIDSNGNDIKFKKNLGINPVTINGVQGNIQINKDSNEYYFTRITEGDETIVNDNTQIMTNSMQDKKENDILIIFTGTNDKPDTTTIQDVINIQKNMINNANTDRYIIIGLTSKNYMPQVAEVNQILAQEYGEHFIDIRTYILEHGLEDAEIKATEQDSSDIQNGEIPSSLRSDEVHGTSKFYTIIGKQVFNKILELGYLNDEQKEYLGIK